MPSPSQITISQLSRLIGLPDCPEIVDVRTEEDFAKFPRAIPGSIRRSYREIAGLVPALAGRRAVVLCHEGLKLSQGSAAILRERGVAAESLEGGFVAWQAASEPSFAASKLPPANAEGRTVWVTRHRPKIDRIACPWFIRRFLDRRALFLFVEPSQVLGVADRFAATPFDVGGVFWSHRDDRCTFDTMLAETGLETDALLRLAAIIRGADTDRHELAPQAAGLLAISLGLSRMYRDDLAQLEAGMAVYDALYRWARDAYNEGHDWPVADVGSPA